MCSDTLEDILVFLQKYQVSQVDLTGGAPEMHPDFKNFIKQLSQLNCEILLRSNLSVLNLPEYSHLMGDLFDNNVTIMASMPCYLEENVDKQRGKGTFNENIQVLKKLNLIGYGNENSGRELNLIYNPLGASLPPSQNSLQQDYKNYMFEKYHVVFNHLFTITNLPIKRFGSMLMSRGEFDGYMQLLMESHQDANLDAVMCRELISIDWQGYIYDCDFNQMLDLGVTRLSNKIHISEYHPEHDQNIPVKVAGHCYGCTAGSGSSCGGVLS